MRVEKSAEAARIIKSTRLAIGLSQQDVAEKVGVTRQSIARIERGEGASSFDTYLKIFAHLGIGITATRNSDLSPAAHAALGQEAVAEVVRNHGDRTVSDLGKSVSGILPTRLAASVRESWKPATAWEGARRALLNSQTSEDQHPGSDDG